MPVKDFKASYRADLRRSLTQARQIREKLEGEESSIANCIKDSEREVVNLQEEIAKVKNAVEVLQSKLTEIATKKSTLEAITALLERSKDTVEEANSVTEMADVIDDVANHKAQFDRFRLLWLTEAPTLSQLLFERRMKVASKMEKRELLRNAARGSQMVYATVTGNDTPRFAEVKFEDGRILLYSLRDGSPPSEGLRIQYDIVRTLADETPPLVFFEITFNGSPQGKIYIILLDNAGRTLQFLYLCTGERGPSYSNTRFLEFANTATYGVKIWGGDYEHNDGTGGAALPGMTRGPQNYEIVTPGLVCGYYYSGYGDDHKPSQFCIYLEESQGNSDMSSLGRIVTSQGLDIAKAISRLPNVRDASVSDCGMMLYSA
ncbi:E3 SUMO-protein ligase RanBP2-like isoform X2 [Macrobrachium nipponense]